MRHRQTTPQLGRTPSHRKAMLRNMVTDFFRHEKIRTTQAKAKALRPYAEKLITLAKKDTLHARRHAARVIRDKEVLRHLFNDLAPRFSERPGGYTRIIKLPNRAGDNAEMAIIELVEAEMKQRKKRKKPRYDGPLTAAAETAASQVKAAEDVVPDAVEEVGEAAEDAIEAAGEVVEDAVEAAKDIAEDVVEKAEEVIDEVSGDDGADDDEEKSE